MAPESMQSEQEHFLRLQAAIAKGRAPLDNNQKQTLTTIFDLLGTAP